MPTLNDYVLKWYDSSNSPSLGAIRSRTNVEQILGVMRQDHLPKRAIRIARRLLVVCDNKLLDRAALTTADRAFCRNWTAHRRNLYLKEFGKFLPLPVLWLARRLAPGKSDGVNFALLRTIIETQRSC